MKRIYRIIALMLALAMCLMMVSCKKKEEQKSDYDKVKKEDKILKVLIAPVNPPFEYRTEDGITGADTALVEKISEQIGVSYELVEKNYADLTDCLIDGEGDIVVSSFIFNGDRDGITFSTVYLDNSLMFVTAASNEDISSVDDLEGKIVAVQENSQSDFYVTDLSNLKDTERLEYVSDCIEKLDSGEVDAVICDINTATYYQNLDPGKYNCISLRDSLEKYVVALREDSDLLPYVNEAISSFKFDEDIQSIITEHTLRPAEPVPDEDTEGSEAVTDEG